MIHHPPGPSFRLNGKTSSEMLDWMSACPEHAMGHLTISPSLSSTRSSPDCNKSSTVFSFLAPKTPPGAAPVSRLIERAVEPALRLYCVDFEQAHDIYKYTTKRSPFAPLLKHVTRPSNAEPVRQEDLTAPGNGRCWRTRDQTRSPTKQLASR